MLNWGDLSAPDLKAGERGPERVCFSDYPGRQPCITPALPGFESVTASLSSLQSWKSTEVGARLVKERGLWVTDEPRGSVGTRDPLTDSNIHQMLVGARICKSAK